jgi:hypothetical protein
MLFSYIWNECWDTVRRIRVYMCVSNAVDPGIPEGRVLAGKITLREMCVFDEVKSFSMEIY